MKIKWDWVPNERLGPVTLGSDINIYISELGAYRDDDDEDDVTGWTRYALPDMDTYIDVEDGKVVGVTSYESFFYDDKNLIGVPLRKLDEALGNTSDEIGEPVEYDNGEVHVPYEYSDLGLQVWVSEGKVVYISCLTYEDENDG